MNSVKRAAAIAAASLASACAALPSQQTSQEPVFSVAPSVDELQARAAIDSAVAGPHRSAADRARDAHRHPAETLAFFGLKPGMTVIEISPGAGWYTEILAPYAAQTGGRYIATGSDLADPQLSNAARAARTRFEERFSDPRYGALEVVNFGPNSGPLGPPGSADMVLTFRNVHNFMATGMWDKVLTDMYAVLKPGGVLGVVEHRAAPGPQDPSAPTGYVTEDYVIQTALRAGFALEARSEVNANPRDTRDHPFGVWTLPPTRRSSFSGQPVDPNFDRAKYDAIGESDRMTLRFVKPAQ